MRIITISLFSSLLGCMEAPSDRDDYADQYDVKMGAAVSRIQDQVLDPQGRLHLFVEITHYFKPSQPRPGDNRYLQKNISQVLYVYDGARWDSLPLLSLYSYSDVFNMGTQGFTYRFAKDPLGLPYIAADSKLQPKLFSFSGDRWQERPLQANQVDWLKNCAQGFWSASDGYLGLCLDPPYSVETEIVGGFIVTPQSVFLRNAKGDKKTLLDETLSKAGYSWQYLDMHRHLDSLDFLLAFQAAAPQPSMELNNVWIRLVRRPGGQFTDPTCKVLVGVPGTTAMRFSSNDTIARILLPNFGPDSTIQSLTQVQWKADTLVSRISNLDSPIPSTNRMDVGPDGCPMITPIPRRLTTGQSGELDSRSPGSIDSYIETVGTGKKVMVDSFSITFGCDPHTDTLFFESAVGKFLFKRVHANSSGHLYVMDFWQKPDTVNSYSKFGLSDSVIMKQIRDQNVLDIRHWKYGVWEKIPVPF